MRDQALDVRGTGIARVDNEIGVLGRDLGATNATALQTTDLDQAGRVITGWVAEGRTATRLTGGLGRAASFQQCADRRLLLLLLALLRDGEMSRREQQSKGSKGSKGSGALCSPF